MTNYQKQDRNPGWIELFFDLSFVVLIGRIAEILHHTQTHLFNLPTIISFLWIFGVQALVWMHYTVYTNYYGDNSMRLKLFTFVLMCGLFLTAIFVQDLFKYNTEITLLLGILTAYTALMYQLSSPKIKENHAYAQYKAKSLFCLAIAVIPALFMSSYLLFFYTTVLYLGEHLLDIRYAHHHHIAPPDSDHFVERIGTFMILVFGESFLTLIDTLDNLKTRNNVLVFILILVVMFFLFINYFTFIDEISSMKHRNYNQILVNNVFVLFSLTLFSAIVYHACTQDLDLLHFKCLILSFTIVFFISNARSYYKLHLLILSILVVVIPLTLNLIAHLLLQSYFAMLLALCLECFLPGILILYYKKYKSIPLKSKNTSKS